MYITSVPTSGYTVFPCLIPEDDPSLASQPDLQRARTALCEAASQNGTVTGYGINDDDGPFGLRQLAADICAGKAPGVMVAPRMGDAVMFRTGVFEPSAEGEAEGADGLGSPDWRLWHSGCHVKEGQTKENSGGAMIKLTMQKFTERSL